VPQWLEGLVSEWRESPEDFVTKSFECDPYGNPTTIDRTQRVILESVRDHDKTAVMSGRGVGKTAAAAMLTHWWLGTHQPGLVITSAGTWSHVEDKLWPEINSWGRRWIMRDLFEYQVMGMYSNIEPETWRAIASVSDKPQNVEGGHNPNLLLLIDEAKAMPDEIYAALIASLSGDRSVGSQKVVVLSTPPTEDVGWYAAACGSTDWNTIHISGLDSERVSKEFVETIRKTFGEESNEYKAYVLGVIPGGVTGQLIRKLWIEHAQSLGPNEDDLRPAVITVDVAREGDDLCTFGVFEQGKFNLVRFDDRWGWLGTSALTDVARHAAWAVRKHKAATVVVDDTGLGGGVTDMLRDMVTEGRLPRDVTIIGAKFGERPRRPDRFSLRKDEMWWELREALRVDEEQAEPLVALPTNQEIAAWGCPRRSDFRSQILGAIYDSDLHEKVHVYDKRVAGKEKTKALPTKSPDLAHALVLGCEYYLSQEQKKRKTQPPTNQEEMLSAMMRQQLERRQPVNPFAR
jgi:phage terminase large subunit